MSGERKLDYDRQNGHRTLYSHGDAAALRRGAGGGGIDFPTVLSSAVPSRSTHK